MFSLIITVISIALVAALAVASVYYGGPALSKGTARASAATIVSQGQQISGAATLFSSDNGGTTVPSLTGTDKVTDKGLVINDYLTSVPAVPAALGSTLGWVLGTADEAGFLVINDAAAGMGDICLEIEKNRDSDVDTVPVGTGTAGAVVAADLSGQFGCIADNATATKHTVYYSL